MSRLSLVSLLALGASPFIHASVAHATTPTPGCNATDPNCDPYDPCTFDVPLAGYDCGSDANNATSNGTFITPAAGLGFTWKIPEAWYPDAYTSIYWDCGIGYTNAVGWPAGCEPIISFGPDHATPQEFLEQMPGFEAYLPTDPQHDEWFSYTFAWWIPGAADVTADQLSLDFVSYYQGLMDWCIDANGNPLPGCSLDGFTAHFTEDGGTCDGRAGELDKSFTGEVSLYDEFFTGDLITLNFIARTHYCARDHHQVVTYSASLVPRPGQTGSTRATDAVWAQLLARQDAFQCD